MSDRLAAIHCAVHDCEDLTSPERMVLLAVLTNLPLTNDEQSSILQAILNLSSPNLKHLAHIFEAGLLAAKNFGGHPSTSQSPVASYDISTRVSTGNKRPFAGSTPPSYSPEEGEPVLKQPRTAASTMLPPAEPTESVPPIDPHAQLFLALGIDHALPTPDADDHCFHRRGSLADECLVRQHNVCPITGHKHNPHILEAANLVPHSAAAIWFLSDTPFWRLLSITVGPAVRDTVYRIVGGTNSFRSTNGIALDSSLRSLFDRGLFWLIPRMASSFDPATTRYYDIEFRWRGELADLSFATTMPRLPSDQVNIGARPMRYVLGERRFVQSGDQFRLFTNDPAEYPLTHPLLLSLHSMLWRMISTAGLAETAKVRNGRFDLNTECGEGARDVRARGVGGKRRGRGPRSEKASGRASRGGARQPENMDMGNEDQQSRQAEVQGTSSTPSSGRSSGPATVTDGTSEWASEKNKTGVVRSEFPVPIEVEFLEFKLQQLAAKRARGEKEGGEEYWEDSEEEEDEIGEEGGVGGVGKGAQCAVSPGMVLEFIGFHHRRPRQATERARSRYGSGSGNI